MSNEIVQDFSEKLNQDEFNFMEVAAGINYPSETVEVYLGEKHAHAIVLAGEKVSALKASLKDATAAEKTKINKEIKALGKVIEELREELEKTKYIFHLSGVPIQVQIDMRTSTEDAIQKERRKFKKGKEVAVKETSKSVVDAGMRLQAAHWSLFVDQIVAPSGNVRTAPGYDVVRDFYASAPQSQRNKVEAAINSLSLSSDEFEKAISADFLAKP